MRRLRPQLLESFEQALEKQRLHMVYQPKVALRDGSLVRVEALVRWDDARTGRGRAFALRPARRATRADRRTDAMGPQGNPQAMARVA
jgi:EAL domain-containing protein (putative c-di-GMP-specific phosphodiesterase class I)